MTVDPPCHRHVLLERSCRRRFAKPVRLSVGLSYRIRPTGFSASVSGVSGCRDTQHIINYRAGGPARCFQADMPCSCSHSRPVRSASASTAGWRDGL